MLACGVFHPGISVLSHPMCLCVCLPHIPSKWQNGLLLPALGSKNLVGTGCSHSSRSHCRPVGCLHDSWCLTCYPEAALHFLFNPAHRFASSSHELLRTTCCCPASSTAPSPACHPSHIQGSKASHLGS